MAEPLKNFYGPDIPLKVAAMIEPVYPEFDTETFVAECLVGYEDLELTPRARHISQCLGARSASGLRGGCPHPHSIIGTADRR